MEYSVRVPFGRAEWAEMVFNTLSVDTELKEDVVQRHYKVEKDVFEATFKAQSAKMLRTSVSSFYDMLLLAVQTLERFG